MTAPRAPISWGELIDKITILEIKLERIQSPRSADNVRRELALLLDLLPEPQPELDALRGELRKMNQRLWDIEDAIRTKEAARAFDAEFIELARSVYRSNDERARIKREINALLRSDIVEEKQYVRYR